MSAGDNHHLITVCRKFGSSTVFAALVFSIAGKFAFAAEGKLSGLGPLKLGISKSEISQTFGAAKPGTESAYDKKVKLLGSTFDLLVLSHENKVSAYQLVQRKASQNSESCLFHSAQIRMAIEKAYIGKPDVVGSGNNIEARLQRNWWIFDDGEVSLDVNLSRSDASNIPGDVCTTLILIHRYNPEVYKLTVVP